MLPVGAFAPPLVALAAAVVVLATLVGVETVRYADKRRTLRATAV